MTMVNAILQGSSAYLYADTAFVDAGTGRVIGFEPKIRVGEHFPWAIGVTIVGPIEGARALRRLGEARDVAELIQQLPRVVKAFHQEAERRGFANPAMRLVVAAWDESCKLPRIFVAGDGTGQEGSFWCPPGVTEVGYFFGAGDDIVAEIAELWDGGTPNDPEAFQLSSDGIAAFEIRRRNSYVPIGGDMAAGCYVGGELHLAVVSSDGVSAAAIHEWPDCVGKAIAGATQ